MEIDYGGLIRVIRKDSSGSDHSLKKSRSNSRSDRQSRPLYLRSSVFSKANGSAYTESGNTKVFAAVYGPRAPRQEEGKHDRATVSCELRFARFSSSTPITFPSSSSNNESLETYKSKLNDVRNVSNPLNTPGIPGSSGGSVNLQSELEMEWSNLLTNAFSSCLVLKKYPKSHIEMHVLIVERDGSELAAAFNALSLALCDAGIEMIDLLIGSCICIQQQQQIDNDAVMESDGRVLVDPELSEVENAQVVVECGILPSLGRVVLTQVNGTVETDELFTLLESAIKVSTATSHLLRKHLIQHEVQLETS